ncbi:MAG TPA: hypothetical protein VH186_10820 [Chloroflexia bacterium]|nr:hypothetical protein [Chloroflexia bacterium]
MTPQDIEAIKQAIEMVECHELAGAYQTFRSLRQRYPSNPRVLLGYAYTSPSLEEAREAIEQVATSLPGHSVVEVARHWLERREKEARIYPATAQTGQAKSPAQVKPASPVPGMENPLIGDADIINTLPLVPARPESWQAASGQDRRSEQPRAGSAPVSLTPLLAGANQAALQPGAGALALPVTPSAKSGKIFSSLFWWRAWFTLLFFITALVIIVIVSKVTGIAAWSDTEIAYIRQISEINQRISSANAALTELEKQRLTSPEQVEKLKQQLLILIEANTQFNSLQSPSARLDHLDSLLSEAYADYSNGAQMLLNAISNNLPDKFSAGNRLLENGNNALHRARDQLKELGLG